MTTVTGIGNQVLSYRVIGHHLALAITALYPDHIYTCTIKRPPLMRLSATLKTMSMPAIKLKQ